MMVIGGPCDGRTYPFDGLVLSFEWPYIDSQQVIRIARYAICNGAFILAGYDGAELLRRNAPSHDTNE